jgi:phosphopantothenate---cysteine ligase (CTP)
MNVLITGGGCREPIDGVRCITNMSTGMTASFIADYFIEAGDRVTALFARQSHLPECAQAEHPRLRLLRYETGQELSALMETELTAHPYDTLIHAAAVSDFIPAVLTVNGVTCPAGRTTGKISSGSQLTVTFEPAPKIAARVRTWAAAGNHSRKTVIVCFKLTDGADRTERLRASTVLFKESSADYIVSNDLSELKNGMHPFELFRKPENTGTQPGTVSSGKTTEELADLLYTLIKQGDIV